MACKEKALKLAKMMHEGQMYGDLPYMAHVHQVVNGVTTFIDKQPGGGIDKARALIVAALHDTVEDTGLTYSDIRKEFGPAIASDVGMLTKNSILSYEENIMRITDGTCFYAVIVKLADNKANAAGDKSHMSETRRAKLEKRYSWSIAHLTEYLTKHGFYV
jgi:(p)ppGpp synthase/HD superfamily hydrolase